MLHGCFFSDLIASSMSSKKKLFKIGSENDFSASLSSSSISLMSFSSSQKVSRLSVLLLNHSIFKAYSHLTQQGIVASIAIQQICPPQIFFQLEYCYIPPSTMSFAYSSFCFALKVTFTFFRVIFIPIRFCSIISYKYLQFY